MSADEKKVITRCVENIKKIIVQFKTEELGNRISNFSLAAFEQVVNQELSILLELSKGATQCQPTAPEQSPSNSEASQ